MRNTKTKGNTYNVCLQILYTWSLVITSSSENVNKSTINKSNGPYSK